MAVGIVSNGKAEYELNTDMELNKFEHIFL